MLLVGRSYGGAVITAAGVAVTVAEGASHVVMLSRPAVVADGIREAVRNCA